jgi:beta propeller repeat protein
VTLELRHQRAVNTGPELAELSALLYTDRSDRRLTGAAASSPVLLQEERSMTHRAFVLAALFAAAAMGWCQGLVEFPVSAEPWAEYQPTISFGTVVWTDLRNIDTTGADLWGTILTIPSQFPVCDSEGDQMRACVDVWGPDILCVWEDYRIPETAPDIWGRFLLSWCLSFPITDFFEQETVPRCWGENVLYQRDSAIETSPDIWCCNLPHMLNYALVQEPGQQETPDICGYNAVWTDNRFLPTEYVWDIWTTDIRPNSQYALTNNFVQDREPDISGEWVVYQTEAMVADEWDIYAVRLGGEMAPVPICTEPGNQLNPAIWGNIVVWEDQRHGVSKIYGYDLTTGHEFPISPLETPDMDVEPDVSENVVVWTRYVSYTPDVYGAIMDFCTITGTVELEQYIGDAQAVQLELELWSLGEQQDPSRIPIRLDPDGHFTATTLLEGWFYIKLKPSHWLRQWLPDVYILEPGTSVNLEFHLINGDAHPDNVVDITDLNTVVSHFGEPAPTDADLDGSGLVDLPDLNIVLLNFGKEGDP